MFYLTSYFKFFPSSGKHDLRGFEKNNNTFPINDTAIPRTIKIDENPSEKSIVLINTVRLSFSISFNFLPVI